MTRRTRQIFLSAIALLNAVMLVLFVTHRDVARDHVPPRDLTGMAAWMTQHPADWLTAAAISDAALDSSLPRRTELWRAAYALARHIAPRRRNPAAAFVRAGLFHWYELNPADRRAVLNSAAPLLRDPQVFDDLYRPLWDLTRDFDYLLRNAPKTLGTLDALRNIAVSNGLFDDYRETRAALHGERLATFEATRSTLAPHDLPQLLPRRIETEDEPLVRRVLEELHARSFDPSRFGDPTTAMIEYAIRHNVRPLEGLTPFVEAMHVIPDVTRARLALALNNPEAATLIELGAAGAVTQEWVPYHLERALFEARRGDAAAADAQLRRAVIGRPDPAVLATAQEAAAILRNHAAAAEFEKHLAALAKQPRAWQGTCGPNELCNSVRAVVPSRGGSIGVEAAVVQSDQIPPYVEIYVDDARVAEGEVVDRRRFVLPAPKGVHEIEVRLVNPRIANGSQRRVRLS